MHIHAHIRLTKCMHIEVSRVLKLLIVLELLVFLIVQNLPNGTRLRPPPIIIYGVIRVHLRILFYQSKSK